MRSDTVSESGCQRKLDTTVPMVLGERLFAAANPPKQWVRIEAGKHSDLDAVARSLYLEAVENFRKAYLVQPGLAPGGEPPKVLN